MKKYFLKFALLFLISLLVTSCNQKADYSKMIVGKYYFNEYTKDIKWYEEFPVSMTIETNEEYFENGTLTESGTIKFGFYNELGDNINITYVYGELKPSKWEIRDSMIYNDYNSDNFVLIFDGTNASSYQDIEYVAILREIIDNDVINNIKQSINERSGKPTEIIELNEKQLVTKFDGNTSTYKRII